MKFKVNKFLLAGLVITLLVVILSSSLFGTSLSIPDDVRLAMDKLPEQLDYNIHVKKILSDKCFACHGPDAAKQKGDLRLDVAEAAYSKETESGLKAIRAGSISKSEIAHRILSEDKDYMMPTPASHLSLSTDEKATLLKWIGQGAEYKPHWAFVAPVKPALPPVEQEGWAKNELDLFVLNRLEKEGLKPSPEADKETLIRRVAFDITGLPPTISEIDAFVKDVSPEAYEKMLDRYLSSPRYGERMAAYWLDVARFADSHGYLDDKHRDATPWRDWVIDAYNKNLPYDKFISWQLAGDLMPNATREQVLATGFNRNTKQNEEAGIIPEEFRVEYNVDRTNTLGSAILGLTVGCAKCHDHKYDPISQKDYFSMFAFFNSTFENGSANYGAEGNILAGPTIFLTSPKQDAELASLTSRIKAMESQLRTVISQAPEQSLQSKVVAKLSFEKVEEINTWTDKKSETVKAIRNPVQPGLSARATAAGLAKGVAGNALKVGEDTRVWFPPYKVGYYERYEPFAFSLWVKAPKNYDEVAILHHSDTRRYGFQGYDLVLKNNRLNFRISHAFPHDAISVLSKEKIDSVNWHHVAVSYDGSSRAQGIQVYLDGKKLDTETEFDALKKNSKPFPSVHKIHYFSGLTFGARDLERNFKEGEIDEFYLFDNTIDAGEAAWLSGHPDIAFAARRPVLRNTDSLQAARMAKAQIYDSVQEAMVMGDLPAPRTTHVLLRGVYDSYGDVVQPGTPASILPYDKRFAKNRLGLTQWLFDPANPLTGRIAINRIWEMYFGRGLVKTTDDFGNQGEMPSHPELMDYLAIRLREEAWDTKKMQKYILMSATYRQSSVISPELLEKDPQNILLARSSRYKMPAEMIRDQALAISGLLSGKVGGKSVYPYQPSGLWEALSDKKWRYVYETSKGEDLFRRSIYTIIKRSAPPPFMLIFDAPDRNFCTVKRTVSSSPLQALALMNDPTFIEASKFIAGRMIGEGGNTEKERLVYGFRLVTGRAPDQKETDLLQEMYRQEKSLYIKTPSKATKILSVGDAQFRNNAAVPETAACVDVVMALLNTDEFITRK